MVKSTILFICVLVYTSFAVGQEHSELAERAVYLELLGKGFISANVDFPLSSNDRLTLGLTMLDHEFQKEDWEENYPTRTYPTPSVMYFHLFGTDKHYFETGAGLSISPVPWKEYSDNDSPLSVHASLGYRYQESDKFFFRAGLTPFYRINWAFLPLVGVSFGYCWRESSR